MATKTKEASRKTFEWQGKDKSGNDSKGKIDAESIASAKALLRKQGINPNKVKKESSLSLGGKRNKPIKPLDIAFFTRQMATMMKAGVPLIQGLDIVGQGAEKVKLKELIYDIRGDVAGGTDFSTALSRHPLYFDDLFVSLVRSGALDLSVAAPQCRSDTPLLTPCGPPRRPNRSSKKRGPQ